MVTVYQCLAIRGASNVAHPRLPRAGALRHPLVAFDERRAHHVLDWPRRLRRVPVSNGGCGSYSTDSWIACATSSPARRAFTFRDG
jgi:hypothetical protein